MKVFVISPYLFSFINDVSHLYADRVPSLALLSNNQSSGNNWGKPSRYRFGCLGEEPVTVVITIWLARRVIEHRSTCDSPEALHGLSQVANFPFLVRAGSSCFMPKQSRENWWVVETFSGTSGENEVNGPSLYERTVVVTIVTSSSPRLADWYIAGFLDLLLELKNGLAKANDWTFGLS